MLTFFIFGKSIQSKIDSSHCDFAVIVRDDEDTYLCTVYFAPGKDYPVISFEGSGMKTVCSKYSETNSRISIRLITLWQGAEEINPDNQRSLLCYNFELDKKTLFNALNKKKNEFIHFTYDLDKNPLTASVYDGKGSVSDSSLILKDNASLRTKPYSSSEKKTLLTESIIEWHDFAVDNDRNVYFLVTVGNEKGYITAKDLEGSWKQLSY